MANATTTTRPARTRNRTSQSSSKGGSTVVKKSATDLIEDRKAEIKKELGNLDTSDKRAFDTLSNNSQKRNTLQAEFKSLGGNVTKTARSRRSNTKVTTATSTPIDVVRSDKFHAIAIYTAFLVVFGLIVTGIVNYLIVTLLIGFILTGLIPWGWLFSIGIFVVCVIAGILLANGFVDARKKKAELA